jgi:hypothetical protein
MSRRPFPVATQPDDREGGTTYSVGFELSRFTGATLVVGETVFLSDDGVSVLANVLETDDPTNAYSFIDAEGKEIGGLYGRDDPTQNVISLRAVDTTGAGEAMIVNVTAIADDDNEPTATATVSFDARISGEATDTAVTLTRNNTTSSIDLTAKGPNGRVRITPKLNLLGADLSQGTIYVKGSKLILHHHDGISDRYKYIDLAGTSAAWSYSASEP